MAKSTRPDKNPPDVADTGGAGVGQPSAFPPSSAAHGKTGEGEDRPREFSMEEQALAARAIAGSAGPSEEPPVQAYGAGGGYAAWQNNKKIDGLWSINQDKNSWVHVVGGTWKRLSTATPSGVMALTVLSSHARQTQSVVNYRDEPDGMIHEMYVW